MLFRTSHIQPDETVFFFPTFGHATPGPNGCQPSGWKISIHGWIFEPARDSIKRRAALSIMRRVLKMDKADAATQLFKERAHLLLVDSKRGKQITIRLGNSEHALPKSAANGHFQQSIEIPTGVVAELIDARQPHPQWLPFQAVTPDSENREFSGRVQLIPTTGLSVITDIDDTIKLSDVQNRRELMRNTFLREFRSVAGMADVYRAWANTGYSFHYVSGSPWQLYQPLSEFLQRERFPDGSVHFRKFRVKDRNALNLIASPEDAKRQAIAEILQAFPNRSFILVGDSGEQDPETYGSFAREFPDQVRRIFIRNVSGESSNSGRLQNAFAGVPLGNWSVFDHAEEMLQHSPVFIE